MTREQLPYRKNCEGYFLYGQDQILAKDTGLGYVEFPGGGVEDMDVAEAMAKETLEETGATISDLTEIGVIYFDWGPEWAKTEKQKLRYQKYRGEEMHLFIGRVAKLQPPTGDPEHGDNGWEGERFIGKDALIALLESFRPFPPTMVEYSEKQLWAVRNLSKLLAED